VAAYIAAMTPGGRVRFEDLPANLRRTAPDMPVQHSQAGPDVRLDLSYMDARRDWLDLFQERYVSAQLEAHGGNVSAAARAAGMDRRSIQRILSRIRGGGDEG
jgi:transcriptional regulator of acetoin/glycerol metabolism